ncbi:MAG: hypothetical protein IKX85_04035, partial [Clostridia bacterium]|nr:hypothetical protein [Clostridia bacterium]
MKGDAIQSEAKDLLPPVFHRERFFVSQLPHNDGGSHCATVTIPRDATGLVRIPAVYYIEEENRKMRHGVRCKTLVRLAAVLNL